ncbi:MAG: hypothetical protein U0800_09905 [Isosphaeraceae bacterium]
MESDDESLKLETAFGELRPATHVDRDTILFEAGRAAGRRSRDRFWAAAVAGLALVSIGEGAMLALRPTPREVERLVLIREPSPDPTPSEVRPEDPVPRPYPSWPVTESPRGRLQRQILRYGLDGLPPTPIGSAADSRPEATIGSLLRSELDALKNPGGPT